MEIDSEAAELIALLKRVGYGWAKYAESVERSGQCSPRQLETLRSMDERIRNHRSPCAPHCEPEDLSPLELLEIERGRLREIERELQQQRTDREIARAQGCIIS